MADLAKSLAASQAETRRTSVANQQSISELHRDLQVIMRQRKDSRRSERGDADETTRRSRSRYEAMKRGENQYGNATTEVDRKKNVLGNGPEGKK